MSSRKEPHIKKDLPKQVFLTFLTGDRLSELEVAQIDLSVIIGAVTQRRL